MLSVTNMPCMLSVNTLNVITLNVVMLNVVAPVILHECNDMPASIAESIQHSILKMKVRWKVNKKLKNENIEFLQLKKLLGSDQKTMFLNIKKRLRRDTFVKPRLANNISKMIQKNKVVCEQSLDPPTRTKAQALFPSNPLSTYALPRFLSQPQHLSSPACLVAYHCSSASCVLTRHSHTQLN
jgi:hypothetical protein